MGYRDRMLERRVNQIVEENRMYEEYVQMLYERHKDEFSTYEQFKTAYEENPEKYESEDDFEYTKGRSANTRSSGSFYLIVSAMIAFFVLCIIIIPMFSDGEYENVKCKHPGMTNREYMAYMKYPYCDDVDEEDIKPFLPTK